MKKLLFVATAALCATVFGAIESTNVVGYQTKTTVGGFNFVAPTFKNVSDTNINIQDVKLSGDAVNDFGDTIQILDDGGAASKVYFWQSGTGWIDTDFNVVNDNIKPGTSVLIETQEAGVKVTFSGAVSKDDLVTTSVAGFNFVGNATPVQISIQDIKLAGDNVSDFGDTIQILDAGGAAATVYFWQTGTGWIDTDFNAATDNLAAGDGVLIETQSAGVEIRVPSAL